jgi:RNA-binding protein NOB1
MLQRIAASRDKKTGELKLHLKKNYNPKSTKSNTSIPKPGKQGRFEGEILLREDQLLTGIWKQKVYQMKKEIKSAFGDDITSDFGLHINKFSNINSGVKNLQFKQKNKKSSR